MKRTSKMIMAAVIVAVLLLGIGYAAIQNITLNIAGTAAADPSQANFKVMFSGTPTVSDDTYVTAAVTDEINATMNVEGLTKKGDVVSATYTVQNASEDLSAVLSVTTTNSNTEFFSLSSEIDKTSLVAGEATTLTVTVELTKTPITDSVSTIIGIQLEAMPVQPGEESGEEPGEESGDESDDTELYDIPGKMNITATAAQQADETYNLQIRAMWNLPETIANLFVMADQSEMNTLKFELNFYLPQLGLADGTDMSGFITLSGSGSDFLEYVSSEYDGGCCRLTYKFKQAYIDDMQYQSPETLLEQLKATTVLNMATFNTTTIEGSTEITGVMDLLKTEDGGSTYNNILPGDAHILIGTSTVNITTN